MNEASFALGFLGLGTYLPDRVLTNADLEEMVDTTDEWIVSRTGIRERRICAPEQTTADLAAEAARAAIADAGLSPDAIDLIICCTCTPDTLSPSVACQVQARLGMTRPCPAFDLSAACSGFVFGCATAAAYIRSGFARHVLVIGAEAMSRVVDFTDRTTCVLFGDGAGAAVLGPCAEGEGLLGQSIASDGSGGDLILIPPIGSSGIDDEVAGGADGGLAQSKRIYLSMHGNEVYKFATRILGPVIEDALRNAGNGLKATDLDLIVPHQANIRILEVAARKLNVPMERFVVNIDKFGNTSAATVPLALMDARRDGRLRPGALVALVAFGGGLTWGASVWRWSAAALGSGA
jgi:3-oxoacyl-[acyl-carrier-protein] synthase-3